jgi:predicted DNA-binding ribbon-helix-helix protein
LNGVTLPQQGGATDETRLSSAMNARKRRRESFNPRTVMVGARRTSVRLEPVMWEALVDISHRQHRSVSAIVTEIDRERGSQSLTAAIRVYIVRFYRAVATATPSDAKSGQNAPPGRF